MSFPTPNAPLSLSKDSGNIAVGVVLDQIVDDTPHPQGFFIRKLNVTEVNYSVFDNELLAIYLTIQHLHHLLEGNILPSTPTINHLFTPSPRYQDVWSARQRYHLTADHGIRLHYSIRSGKRNPIADALFRVRINEMHLVLHYELLGNKHFFKMIHGLTHPSGCSTTKLMKQKVNWQGISDDVRR